MPGVDGEASKMNARYKSCKQVLCVEKFGPVIWSLCVPPQRDTTDRQQNGVVEREHPDRAPGIEDLEVTLSPLAAEKHPRNQKTRQNKEDRNTHPGDVQDHLQGVRPERSIFEHPEKVVRSEDKQKRISADTFQLGVVLRWHRLLSLQELGQLLKREKVD